ncbi:MAG: peptide chain release factor-like protein [Phycisphaerales bacterium]|nr:peptide chain release factor-like protein [Planctomycetota bacterium]
MPQERPENPLPAPLGAIHPAALSQEELLRQVRMTRGRDGGPGGQHRNKVETKVMLLHEPTGVQAQASERRSQEENRREAVWRLRLALAVQVRSVLVARDSFGDVTSDLWRSRCKGGRIVCSPKHADYPALLAEALNVIEASGLDPRKAALRLSCTASQLIRFVKDHPAAMEHWNRLRQERDLHALK